VVHKILPPSGGPAEVGCRASRPRDPGVPSPLAPSPRSRSDHREPEGGGGPAQCREVVPRRRHVPEHERDAPPVRPSVRSRGTTAKDPASFEVTSAAGRFGIPGGPGPRSGRSVRNASRSGMPRDRGKARRGVSGLSVGNIGPRGAGAGGRCDSHGVGGERNPRPYLLPARHVNDGICRGRASRAPRKIGMEGSLARLGDGALPLVAIWRDPSGVVARK
jgi:hypothetical protein